MKLTGYARNTQSAQLFLNQQATVSEWRELDKDHIEFEYDSEIDARSHVDVDFHSNSASELDEALGGRERERERIEALTAYVVVSDGQTRWIAEMEELMDALEALGWARDSNTWTEPEGYEPGECIDAAPYTKLCERVADRTGDLLQKEWLMLPEFSWYPAEACWRLWE